MEGGQFRRNQMSFVPIRCVPPSASKPLGSFRALSVPAAVPTQTRPAALGGDTVESGSTYARWDAVSQGFLLEWLETPGNYALYRDSGRLKPNSSASSSGKTKAHDYAQCRRNSGSKKPNGYGSSTWTSRKTRAYVLHLIFEFLSSKNVFKSTPQIHSKIKYLESSYHRATSFLRSTGQVLTSVDENGTAGIRNKILLMCPLFERLDAFMSDRVSPNVGVESLNSVTADVLVIGSGDAFNVPSESEAPLDCSPEEPEVPPQQDPIPSQVPPMPSTIQGSPSKDEPAASKQKRGKQKEKGTTEALLALLERKRKLGEQKLALRAEWQSKQFELLNRKLDLQHEEMSLRRKSLEYRNLKLELELERLRGKRKKTGGSAEEAQEETNNVSLTPAG